VPSAHRSAARVRPAAPALRAVKRGPPRRVTNSRRSMLTVAGPWAGGTAAHVRRIKNGSPSTHRLTGWELRALRQHQRESSRSPFVFVSERGAPLNPAGFSRMVERTGKAVGLGPQGPRHMLRHACGYALANAGHDTRSLQAYLGYRNIQNTVRYSELAPTRFARWCRINRKKPWLHASTRASLHAWSRASPP